MKFVSNTFWILPITPRSALRIPRFIGLRPPRLGENVSHLFLTTDEHGLTRIQLPATLEDVTPAIQPAVPLDPYSDQPVRYQRPPRGFRVYSVGPDHADDGGKERPKDAAEAEHWDFTVER